MLSLFVEERSNTYLLPVWISSIELESCLSFRQQILVGKKIPGAVGRNKTGILHCSKKKKKTAKVVLYKTQKPKTSFQSLLKKISIC